MNNSNVYDKYVTSEIDRLHSVWLDVRGSAEAHRRQAEELLRQAEEEERTASRIRAAVLALQNKD